MEIALWNKRHPVGVLKDPRAHPISMTKGSHVITLSRGFTVLSQKVHFTCLFEHNIVQKAQRVRQTVWTEKKLKHFGSRVCLLVSFLARPLNPRASVLRTFDFMTFRLSNKVFWRYYGSRFVLGPGNVEANRIGGGCLWGVHNQIGNLTPARQITTLCFRCRAGKLKPRFQIFWAL